MNKLIRPFALSAIIVLILTSCNLSTVNPAQTPLNLAQPTVPPSELVTIELIVQADTSVPFNAVGQVIKYTYAIKHTGVLSVPGIVTVTGATVTCPDIKTIGNLDIMLDTNEVFVCNSTYSITQADLDKGSVTSVTTANVYGILSNPVTTTVPTLQNVTLLLTKTANPVTYDRLGQTITYTYVIKNNGSGILGPAQFTVKDNGISATINCGDANTILNLNATVTCSAPYLITQADLDAPSVATSATAFGAGMGSSPPASTTITRSNVVQTNPANRMPGSTIQHQVAPGEWLWQIARCYGADPNQVIWANPQLPNPAQISPNTIISVPNIGSIGTIYTGAHCVENIVVKNGDTWNSLAQICNADPGLTQQVNPGGLIPGSTVRVPCNSAGTLVSVTPIPANTIRISFAPGATSATVSGIALSGNRTVHYVLAASQGQIMTVKLTAPANSVSMVIYAPNGSTLKPGDLTLTWSGTLSSTGDYKIDVTNALLSAGEIPFTLEVSITSNCVDITRNVKLGTSAAAPTHFNICGTMDASGKAKISTIHIYQRPEDVGPGGLLQDINVTVETATPLNDLNSLIVGDMNYDGNDDFRIVKNVPAGPNIPYLYYLYDPATRQFVYNAAYGNITSPTFPGNSQIVSKWRESAAKWGIDTYTIVANNPILSQREVWEVINATQASHRITVFLSNGTTQVIVDEIIPIPTQ